MDQYIKIMCKTVLFVLLYFVYVSWALRYDDYKLYCLTPINEDQIENIKKLQYNTSLDLDFWNFPTRADVPINVMVPPKTDGVFHNILQGLDINFHTKSDNVQRLIDEQLLDVSQRSGNINKFGWKKYNTYDQINKWLKETTDNNKYATLFTAGRSYEGRPIKGVKVSFGKRKNAVFIEGGVHAREWIAPATVTYILNEILTSKNADIRRVANMYDWYFVPTINPDGYVHTFTTNRLWRRTRSKGVKCKGADGNRNWDFHWNETGTSGECLDFYPGKFASSEPEVKSLSQFLRRLSKKQNISVYLAIHSPFQQLLLPYAFGERPTNYNDMLEIGKKAVASLTKRHGTKFDVGNWAEEMYPSSGVSMDWVTGVLKVPFAYTYELRDREYLFLLPPRYIIPVGEETMDSIVTLIQEINARGY